MKTFTNLHNLHNCFTSENKCIKYLEKIRWNNEPACLRCGSLRPYTIKNNNKLTWYKCKECNYKFNVLIGTIFENTKLPLVKWFKSIYIVTSHKKGISSIQLGKDLGFTQKTAWFVLGRIRKLAECKVPFMLEKTVELDHTFIGGSIENKHVKERKKLKRLDNKGVVLGLVQRNGKMVYKVVPNTKAVNSIPTMLETVKKGSNIFTDTSNTFIRLRKDYSHACVNHDINEYVRGYIHTNTIEGAFSLLKRGIVGIYHKVSIKHLHRYCNEFAFRYNTKELKEVERFTEAVKQIENTRLKYSEYIKEI